MKFISARKKLVFIVAAIVLVSLGMFQFAKAANTNYSIEEKARKLYNVKLFLGKSAESYNPDLGSSLTRQDGIIMMVRLIAKEDEALAMTDDMATSALERFVDKDQIDVYAKKYVAYSVQHNLVEGLPDNLMAPQSELEGNAFCTMILRNIGYSVIGEEYHRACDMLAEKGGLTYTEAQSINHKALTRGDAVNVAYNSLYAKRPDGRYLIQYLIDNHVREEYQFRDAGFDLSFINTQNDTNYYKDSTSYNSNAKYKVYDVTVKNDNEKIVVKFNRDVDSEDENDFKFTLKHDDEIIKNYDVDFDGDEAILECDDRSFDDGNYLLDVKYKGERIIKDGDREFDIDDDDYVSSWRKSHIDYIDINNDKTAMYAVFDRSIGSYDHRDYEMVIYKYNSEEDYKASRSTKICDLKGNQSDKRIDWSARRFTVYYDGYDKEKKYPDGIYEVKVYYKDSLKETKKIYVNYATNTYDLEDAKLSQDNKTLILKWSYEIPANSKIKISRQDENGKYQSIAVADEGKKEGVITKSAREINLHLYNAENKEFESGKYKIELDTPDNRHYCVMDKTVEKK